MQWYAASSCCSCRSPFACQRRLKCSIAARSCYSDNGVSCFVWSLQIPQLSTNSTEKWRPVETLSENVTVFVECESECAVTSWCNFPFFNKTLLCCLDKHRLQHHSFTRYPSCNLGTASSVTSLAVTTHTVPWCGSQSLLERAVHQKQLFSFVRISLSSSKGSENQPLSRASLRPLRQSAGCFGHNGLTCSERTKCVMCLTSATLK